MKYEVAEVAEAARTQVFEFICLYLKKKWNLEAL